MLSNCFYAKSIVRMAHDGSQTNVQHCGASQCSHLGKLLDESICQECPQQLLLVTEGSELQLTTVMIFRCSKCHLEIHGPYKGKHRCPYDVPLMPTLSTRLTTYTGAVARWVTAGSPKRSDEAVERIYKICSGGTCDWFEYGSCRGCGCRVNTSSFALVNKIRMATEHCPRTFW